MDLKAFLTKFGLDVPSYLASGDRRRDDASGAECNSAAVGNLFPACRQIIE